ncbi:MAG: hypothetical protein ACETWR_07720 [Anaerolineae bacterium]
MQGSNASAQSPMQKGISFTAWWSGHYREPGADLSLEFLTSTGANWIALIVTAHQETYTSTTIDFTDVSTPTDEDLIHVINKAHSLGLKVMLKPHLDLRDETTTGYWRGDIGSGFTTEAQWSAWFASYKDFIEHYASLAQTYGADQFCVGTELLGTTHRADDWRAVIAGVRAVYDGPLTYAALKNGEETSITWWDAVDYIGVDGYYRLNTDISSHPTVEELEAAWEGPKAVLANLSATYGKPILLTEIGYRSHHGCSCHPWDSLIVSPLDFEEQAYAYEAAFRQLYNEPWLAGIFWWQWRADPFQSGPCDDGYSPHLKPAEDVLRAWYGGAPRPPQPFLVGDYDQTIDIYTDGLASGWQDWSWNADRTFDATDQAFGGTQSIALTLGPWGSLSLWHPAFSSDQYHWLEFYVRGSSSSQPNLSAFFDSENGTKLVHVPVNDCRHIGGGTIDAGIWKRVRIPLSYLNAPDLPLVRLNIQDQSGQGSTLFWIDDLRLVGAKEPVFSSWVYLPMVGRNH